MKKVALVCYDLSVRGGVEQVTVSLAGALSECYEVYVISLVLTGKPAYELDERVHLVAFLDEQARLKTMRRRVRPLLVRFLREKGIEVLLLQGSYQGFLCCDARFLTRTKLIFCDHGAIRNEWDDRKMVIIRAINALVSHRTVTLTQRNLKDYIRVFRTPRRKLWCIYNWIDMDMPHSENYAADSKRIVSAGRFTAEKGFDMLVEAFAPVAAKHPDWHLDIYGDGILMPQIRALVEQHSLAENVHLMGMRNDLAAHYGDYAMYVLPSYREGLPLVLLEAKANRLPIVSFDVMTGPREIVRDGVDGILVAPQDTQALGNAMCELIEDETLRSEMAGRSQENLDIFLKPNVLRQWVSLIEGLTGKRKMG